MQNTLQIPRYSDLELVRLLGLIVADVPELAGCTYRAISLFGDDISSITEPPEKSPALKTILEASTESLQTIGLIKAGTGRWVLHVGRQFQKDTDALTFDQNFINEERTGNSDMLLRVWATARRRFKALQAEVSMSTEETKDFGRFKAVHTRLISSLEQSAQTLIADTARLHSNLEESRQRKFDELETALRGELSKERERLESQIEAKEADLAKRSQELDEKWKDFEKEESHLVARKKREEQVKDIRDGLKKWELTKETTQKRIPVAIAYCVGVVGGGCFAWLASNQLFELIKPPADPSKVQMWQWISLSLKIAVSFAFSATCLVYFIRWSSAWARIHADEELRNRSLLIDIGRSAWLLEAVRDAQERKGEIPLDLLKELSRNMFAYTKASDGDVEPQAFSDMLMQGLSSLRLKAPDGTEVEAKRGKQTS